MAIGQIETLRDDFIEGVDLAHRQKKNAAKGLLNNAGILVGVFIIFAVIIIVTTDISLVNPEEIEKHAVDFILLLFCTYSMYVNFSDSGMRLGLRNEEYIKATNRFEDKKQVIINNRDQKRLHEFCTYYIKKELENTKMHILAVVGFDYETYLERWVMLSDKQIRSMATLTKPQKDAIIRANSITPIVLTPEMIMKRGRKGGKRAPLGMDPQQKKTINFGIKLVTSIITVLFWTSMVVEFVIEPTWELFVMIVLRSLLLVVNGYSGYKFGYENIVFDTTNYMSDQTDLMEQAIQYFEETPAVT